MSGPDSLAELAGQVALVSGGAGDIGLAITLELARRGASVVACDVRGDTRRFEAATEAFAGRCRIDKVDVTDAALVASWIDGISAVWGPPVIVVPNAAMVIAEDLETLDLANWRRQFAVNLDGALNLALPAARRMRAGGVPGRIVFVGSWAAHQVHPEIPAYCVSKAALRMLVRCMAAEYAPYGILINEVAPGFVNAGMGRTGPEQAEQLSRQVPVRALSTAENVAREVAHLCSPSNRHVTGSTLLMDGGLSLLGLPPVEHDSPK